MTGICAAFACFKIGSQPSSTLGARMMASTRCAMNVPSALIWFSCFCCASENLRFTARLAASYRTEVVSAVRQALSAPICEKPTVMVFFAASFAVDAPVVSEDSRLHAVRKNAPVMVATIRISLRIVVLLVGSTTKSTSRQLAGRHVLKLVRRNSRGHEASNNHGMGLCTCFGAVLD